MLEAQEVADGPSATLKVDGWRGHLDDSIGTEKTWRLTHEDLETGPFGWLI